MNWRAPVAILTDQAPAMRRALSIAMPETRHCWCIWHITSKFGDNLGRYKEYKELKEELLVAVYDSYATEEFESNWNEVIDKYGLEGNNWLKGLYNERDMWVPAFLRHIFWAGMETTQRVESIHI